MQTVEKLKCVEELRLLNEVDAARILGVSKRCLQNWRSRGGGPPVVKLSSRLCRYSIADLAAWVDQKRKEDGRENP